MRKKNSQSLKEVLGQMIDVYRMNGKLKEVEIYNNWDTIVGKVVSKYTERIEIRGDKLFVYLNSSVVRDEISYVKSEIKERINKHLKTDFISEIYLK